MDTNFLVKRDVADLVNTSSYLRKLLFEGVSVHMINKGNPVLAWGAVRSQDRGPEQKRDTGSP